MSNILHIDSSANLTTSVSRAASAKIVAGLGGTVVHRSDEDAARLALSDALVAELRAADTIVIGAPIYNFAGPASLKLWMDLVARPRETFKYIPDGPVGLLANKKAIVVVASGGVPVGSQMDFLTPHIKLFLGFIGITDVEVLAAKDVVEPAAA